MRSIELVRCNGRVVGNVRRFSRGAVLAIAMLSVPAQAQRPSYSPGELDILRFCSAQIAFEGQKMRRAGRVFNSHEDVTDFLFYRFFENMKFMNRQELERRLASHSEEQYRPGFGYESGICAYKRRMQQLDNPSILGTSSAPRSAPKVAAPAEKLPPARPAETAPWSPKALPARQATLSPSLAAERADIMAACTASLLRAHPGQPRGEIALEYETQLLDDTTLGASSQELAKKVSRLDNWIASNAGSPELPSYRLGKCLIQRRIAQLEGAPLATGAVDGTLTPLSIAGQTPPSKQQGKDAKIIASDGKSAMDCVKLVELAKTDSSTSGGGRVLSNQCSGPVEIVWCISPGECQRGSGNAWTVAAGRSWPVSAQGEVRWAACHGANTAAHVKGSFGLRYYCSAPAKK